MSPIPPTAPGAPGGDGPGHTGPGSNGRGGGSSRSLLALVTLALRHRRLLIGLPLAVMALAVVLSFIVPAEHTATSRLVPETEQDMPSDIAGMAAQFGVAMGAGQTESLDFYAQLLQSHELLSAVALHEYEFATDDGEETLRGDLITLYDIDGDSQKERVNAAVKRLDGDLSAIMDRAANVLVLEVRAPWPDLAESINRRILTLVNDFNLERRQSRAAREQAFLEQRVAEAEAELTAAENRLQEFVENNRRYSESPETALEFSRLQRRVDRLQQVYSAMTQNLEQARVDAIRNVPVVTVLDRPEGTAEQTSPRLMVNAVLGFLLGAALAACILLLGEILRSARRSNPRDYSELESATRETLDGLRPFRRTRGVRAIGAGKQEGDGA